jgi:hypothetical protein
VRGLRPAGDLRGCEEDGSRDCLDFDDDSVAEFRYVEKDDGLID